jgi:carbonic anhydrase
MTNRKLILVCPDCRLENVIKNKFEGQVYFMTAFGAFLEPNEDSFRETLINIIEEKKIDQIILISDSMCSAFEKYFNMNGTLLDFEGNHLMSTKSKFQSLLKLERDVKEKKKILTELVLVDQAEKLYRSEYLNGMIKSGKLAINAYSFNQANDQFDQLLIVNKDCPEFKESNSFEYFN